MYKYANTHEWLKDYASRKALKRPMLESIIGALAHELDADTLQDIFQDEMDRDGFFEPVDAQKANRRGTKESR